MRPTRCDNDANSASPVLRTPSPLLGEREHPIPRCDESRRSGSAKARRAILPLPKGEGRGEGEAILETPMYLRTADRHNDKGTVRPAIQCRATRKTKRVRFATKRRAILPLPKGEGRGEGNSSPLESNLELAALATVRTSAFDRLWDRWMANFDCERRSSCGCKIRPAVLIGCVSFPLTLALSLREREHLLPRCSESRRSGPAKARLTILPLPKGEGRGEGNSSLLERSLG